MKKTIYIACGLLLATLGSCKKNTITQFGDVATGAQIKVIHAAPGVPALDVYVNNTKINPATAVSVSDNGIPTSITTGYVYQGVFPSSNYASVAAGSTVIKISTSTPVPALKSAQTVAPGTTVGTITQSTTAGSAYSIFTIGRPGSATNGLTTKVVEDKFPAAASNKAYVRLAYMIPDGAAVDLTGTYTPTGATAATTKTLITNTTYSNVTDFVAVDVNPSSTTGYIFQLNAAGTSTKIGTALGTTASPTALTPGRYYTIVGRGIMADYTVPGTSVVLKATARPTVPASTLPEIYFNPAGLTYYTNK